MKYRLSVDTILFSNSIVHFYSHKCYILLQPGRREVVVFLPIKLLEVMLIVALGYHGNRFSR